MLVHFCLATAILHHRWNSPTSYTKDILAYLSDINLVVLDWFYYIWAQSCSRCYSWGTNLCWEVEVHDSTEVGYQHSYTHCCYGALFRVVDILTYWVTRCWPDFHRNLPVVSSLFQSLSSRAMNGIAIIMHWTSWLKYQPQTHLNSVHFTS